MKEARGWDDHKRAVALWPRRRERDLVLTELEHEVVVYDTRAQQIHCLNQTSAFVWTHCDGRTTVAQLVALAQEQIDQSLGDDVVWLALQQLEEAKLLEEQVGLPGEKTRYSRRTVLKKGAAMTGAALLLPVISSIVAPTRAEAASFVLNCGNPCSTDADCNVPGAVCPSCDPTLLTCV